MLSGGNRFITRLSTGRSYFTPFRLKESFQVGLIENTGVNIDGALGPTRCSGPTCERRGGTESLTAVLTHFSNAKVVNEQFLIIRVQKGFCFS